MIKRYIVLSIALLAFSCNQQDANFFDVKKGKEHQIPALKIAINDYGWKAMPDSYGVPLVVMRPQEKGDEFIESLNVLTEYVGDLTLEQYYETSFHAMQDAMNEFKLLGKSKDTIDGVFFNKTIYQYKPKDEILQFVLYNGIINKMGYVITGTSNEKKFDYYLPQLEAIAESITFKTVDESRYYNSKMGVSVVNSLNWEIKENVQDIPVFFLSPLTSEEDNFQENINMVSEPVGDYSLEEYYQANLKSMDKFVTDFTIKSEPSDIILDNKTFKKVAYSHSTQGLDITVLVYFTVFNKKGYVINASALTSTYTNYKPKFEELISSFKFEL